jgi:hypothetical protein
MKAYQVFEGEEDKHGRQIYNLLATYLDKDRALAHCTQIAVNAKLYDGDILEESQFYNINKSKDWDIIGWDRVTIVRFVEIEITE